MSRLGAMSARRRLAALAAAVGVAGALASCGSSDTLPNDIPAASAPGLIENLNQILSKCSDDPRATANAVRAYQSALSDLPDTIDPDVKKVLTETADNLTTLAAHKAGCQSGVTGTSGLQGFQPDTTATSTTTAPTTEATSTTTTTTTTTPTQPETPPPNGNGEGPGGEGSNGQGPSGEGPPGQGGSPSPGSGGGVGIGNGD